MAILAFTADNSACPKTEFTTNSAEILAAEAVAAWTADATRTTCTMDGVAVPGLENPTNTIYNKVAVPFSYTTAERDNLVAVSEGEPCLPGGLTVHPAAADGAYLMSEGGLSGQAAAGHRPRSVRSKLCLQCSATL